MAGMLSIRLHDLRHVNALLDLTAGTRVKAVIDRLGHADPSITLRVYAHTLPDEEAEAAQRMSQLLRVADNTDNTSGDEQVS